MKNEYLEKAAIHLLGEDIGFEEAIFYWDMLYKKEKINLSRSKKYRSLQNLFNLGFLLRIKQKGVYNYIPFPPNFLLKYNLDKQFVEEKVKDYFMNYSSYFGEDVLFESCGDLIDFFISFFIKYFMKSKALMMIGGPPIYNILKREIPEKFDKIDFLAISSYFTGDFMKSSNLKFKSKELISDRRYCIIDNSLLICFFKSIENRYMGYITSNKDLIQEKIDEFNTLWKLK